LILFFFFNNYFLLSIFLFYYLCLKLHLNTSPNNRANKQQPSNPPPTTPTITNIENDQNHNTCHKTPTTALCFCQNCLTIQATVCGILPLVYSLSSQQIPFSRTLRKNITVKIQKPNIRNLIKVNSQAYLFSYISPEL